MTRRPSTVASSSQARAQLRRLAARNAPPEPHVSYTAIVNMVDRECEKRDLRWYGIASARAVIEEIRVANPETRKIARQMFLDRLDAFPPKASGECPGGQP